MVYIKVAIVRYISNDPQPGVVECELVDAHGNLWRFVEKTTIVSESDLSEQTHYPKSGVIAGEVIGRGEMASGREYWIVDTQKPWDIQSVEGVQEFEVFPESLASEHEA